MRHQLEKVKKYWVITLRLIVHKSEHKMTKFYNVVTRKTISENDINKKIYHKVGVVKVTENGGWFLQLYHQPDTDYMIFANHNENLPVIDFVPHEIE